MSTLPITTTSANAATTTATPIEANPEQAVAFAALILADDKVSITAEKLQILLKAAGIDSVEPIWTTLFANALKDKDVKDILTSVATSGPKARGDIAQHTHCDGDSAYGDSVDDGIDILEYDSDDMCPGYFFD